MNKQLKNFIKENYNAAAPKARVIQSGQGAYLTIDGKKYLNLCSSHYLGLAEDPRIKKAVIEAVEKYGMGTGYRTLAGTHELHLRLEKALADFKNAEAAIVINAGYMANCAAIQTIMAKDDVIISDELNHASIIDAVRLSGVKNKYIYKHSNMEDLEGILINVSSPSSRGSIEIDSRLRGNDNGLSGNDNSTASPKILIVTDGVFSMDGDLAALPQIVELAEKYGASTMVDDAHGEGVLGKGGRGIVDHFGLHSRIDIEVGTLSKAFSVMGGFITGKKELVDFLRQKARQYLFSSALTIADTAALIEGVRIVTESDLLVKKLWENTEYLKSSLTKLGFDIGKSQSPITPLMLGDEDLATKFSSELFQEGVFATPIKFPMVAKGAARIRLIPSAAHSKEDLQFAIERIEKVGKKLDGL